MGAQSFEGRTIFIQICRIILQIPISPATNLKKKTYTVCLFFSSSMCLILRNLSIFFDLHIYNCVYMSVCVFGGTERKTENVIQRDMLKYSS